MKRFHCYGVFHIEAHFRDKSVSIIVSMNSNGQEVAEICVAV